MKHLFAHITAFLIFPFASASVFAQAGSTALKVRADHAVFKSPHPQFAALEIYQSISRNGLTYRKEGGIYVARFRLETEIRNNAISDTLEAVVASDSVTSLAKIRRGQAFVYAVRGVLQAGSYTVKSTLIDEQSGEQAIHMMPIEVFPIAADSLQLSDIQFASKIDRAHEASDPFDKNNLHVVPNVQRLYGDDMENIRFYVEVYNLPLRPDSAEGTYRVDYVIEDFEGNPLYRIPGRSRHKRARDAVIYASFDLSSLPTGEYSLRVEVWDDTGARASQARPFHVYRQAEALAMQRARERNVYSRMDSSALENYFAQIRYIADQEEKRLFPELSLDGKRDFLVAFWKKRDPTPETPRNEFKEDFIMRLMKARVHFSYGDHPGWKSDRGRILLTYGTPDFIEREAKSSRKNGYEIWEYQNLRGQGKHLFVFIDYNENSAYPLIHSTFRDEISNSDWQTYLYK